MAEHADPHRGRPLPGAVADALADDDGSAAAGVRAALQQAVVTGSERDYFAAVAELCLSRLLVPIVAAGDEAAPGAGPDGPAKQAEMSAVLLQAADGQRAMLSFTGVDALTAWNPQARPVPATLDKAAEACLQTGAQVLLVDLQGPWPLVLEQPLLGELAQSHRLAQLPDGNFAWLKPADPGDPAGE